MGTVGVRGQGKATGKAMVGWFGRGLQPKRKRAKRKKGSEERVRKEGGTEGRREHGKAVRKKEI